jgi:hypothetical protein
MHVLDVLRHDLLRVDLSVAIGVAQQQHIGLPGAARIDVAVGRHLQPAHMLHVLGVHIDLEARRQLQLQEQQFIKLDRRRFEHHGGHRVGAVARWQLRRCVRSMKVPSARTVRKREAACMRRPRE